MKYKISSYEYPLNEKVEAESIDEAIAILLKFHPIAKENEKYVVLVESKKEMGRRFVAGGELVPENARVEKVETEPLCTIKEWLSSMDLDHYYDNFNSNDIKFAQLASLTDDELKDIGINSLGHRKTILQKIAETTNLEKEKIESYRQEDSKETFKVLIYIHLILTILAELILNGIYNSPGFGLIGSAILFIYLLPTFLAFRNGLRYKWVMLGANLFLGLTY